MSPEALRVICLVAGVLGVVAGAGLVVLPGRALREGGPWRRWLLEMDLVALLDRRQSIERPVYRHHYAFGAGVVVGTVAWLVVLWELSDHPVVVRVLADALGAWGSRVLILTAWVIAVFALGIGLFVLIRPSAIKGLEAASNRWLEPFPSVSRPGDAIWVEFIGRWVLRVPRLSGALLLVAGLGCFRVLA